MGEEEEGGKEYSLDSPMEYNPPSHWNLPMDWNWYNELESTYGSPIGTMIRRRKRRKVVVMVRMSSSPWVAGDVSNNSMLLRWYCQKRYWRHWYDVYLYVWKKNWTFDIELARER